MRNTTKMLATTLASMAMAVAFALSLGVTSVQAQVAYNGTGSTTHSAVTTAYTGNQLFALNTSGNAAASPIVIGATTPGQRLIEKAMIFSSGTNQPPSITLWLFLAPPFTTGLVDRSAYIGPYAVDFNNNLYLGSLTCSSWAKTNDGTAQYFSECSGSGLLINILPVATGAGKTTIYALEEIGGAGYTPIASEKHSYFLSTLYPN
jgi:hypothetical protein